MNVVGSGGKVAFSATHLGGRSSECGADARHDRPRRRVRAERASASTASIPGATLTGRVQEGLAVGGEDDRPRRSRAAAAQMQAKIPLGRLGTPEEVARVALFLASDARELRDGRDRADGRRSRRII